MNILENRSVQRQVRQGGKGQRQLRVGRRGGRCQGVGAGEDRGSRQGQPLYLSRASAPYSSAWPPILLKAVLTLLLSAADSTMMTPPSRQPQHGCPRRPPPPLYAVLGLRPPRLGPGVLEPGQAGPPQVPPRPAPLRPGTGTGTAGWLGITVRACSKAGGWALPHRHMVT